MKIDKIKIKIKELGGIEKINNFQEDTSINLADALELPSFLKDFLKEYGYGMFNNDVGFKTKEDIPVTKNKNELCPFGIFYGMGSADNSIIQMKKTYEDRISHEYLPIAEATPGDQICYCLKGSNENKIFFWHHESNEREDLFLIANSFEEFINKLEEIPNDDDGSRTITDEWFADDF